MNENEPTRIDRPADLLKDVAEGNLPEAVSHNDIMWELYGADPDVRDVLALIKNPTDRRLAVERMRNLSRDQREQLKDIERDMRMRAMEAKLDAAITTIREGIRQQQERCDRVMRGETIGCRPLETKTSDLDKRLGALETAQKDRKDWGRWVAGIVSAAIVTILQWLVRFFVEGRK